MDTTKLLELLTLLLLLVWLGPTALRMNLARGTTLRHLVLWLAIIVGLMFLYRFLPNGLV